MSTSLSRSFYALTLLLATYAFAQQPRPPLITRPIDESSLVTLHGNIHPMAKPMFDVGAAPPDLPMNRMLLVLRRDAQQEHALRTLLDSQQDSAAPAYHKWLTPDEFGLRFGPSDQDLQMITDWLQSHGLRINRVTHGRTAIEFSGSEAEVESAFHTQIHKYVMPNGEQHWANASAPQIPAAVAPAVAGIWSLHDFKKQPNIHILPEVLSTKYTPGKQPDTNLTGQNGTIHALSPADYATIYNINPVYASGNYGQSTTTQGMSVAVVGRSDLFEGGQDVQYFDSFFPSTTICCASVQTVFDGPDPGDLGGGEEAEATLDVSWSSAMAPGSQIYFVVSASTNTTDGVDLSALYIVDNNISPIMTESFSLCDALASPIDAQAVFALAEQAAAQGITFMVSSGDSGAAGCDDPGTSPATHGKSVNLLASTPFNVAVGGTEFNEGTSASKYWGPQNNQSNLGSALSYIPETAWNDSCSACSFPNLLSTGGGASQYNAKPSWQSGVSGIPADGARDLPDVSLSASASHDPYILCLEGSCVPDSQGRISLWLIGGTSASAPSLAGIMALVDYQNGPQGVPNYILYKLAAGETLSQCNSSSSTLPASTCIFNDVTSGNNTVPGVQGFAASTGYDLATGLGSPNVANLVNKWNSVQFIGTVATLSPASITATHGSPVTLNVGVSPTSGSGVPTGNVGLVAGINGANNNFIASGTGVGVLTLSGGSGSMQFRNLPGGSYSLYATYAGDATFAPSPLSNPVSVNISPENSTTSLSLLDLNGLPFASGPYGSIVYVRADVKSNSSFGLPTGFVNFQFSEPGSNNPFLQQPLNSEGNAAILSAATVFPAGQTSITASYNGDSSFNPSTASPVALTITQASTSTSLTASPASAAAGTSVSLQATVNATGFGQAPTGTVNFFLGNTQIGAAPLFANTSTGSGVSSTATLSAANLAVGQNSVTAQYGGDPNYLASSSSSTTVSISADFAFAPASSSVSVPQGGTAQEVLSITGQTGYANTVAFSSASCAGLPSLTTCSFNPPSVAGSGSTTVSMRTTAPSFAAVRATRFGAVGFAAVGFVFAGMLLMGAPSRRFRSCAALAVVLGIFALGSVACGGGSSTTGCGSGGSCGNPGTPKGSYPITVTATTADHAITHTVSFTLVVQ